MPQCPSTLCRKENPEGREYCSDCGVELSLPADEVKARDAIFEAFKTAVKEHPEEYGVKNLARPNFEYALEKSVGRLFAIAVEHGAKKSPEKKETTTEQDILKIEKEKLKILKEISKDLKENLIKSKKPTIGLKILKLL